MLVLPVNYTVVSLCATMCVARHLPTIRYLSSCVRCPENCSLYDASCMIFYYLTWSIIDPLSSVRNSIIHIFFFDDIRCRCCHFCISKSLPLQMQFTHLSFTFACYFYSSIFLRYSYVHYFLIIPFSMQRPIFSGPL